MIRNLWNSLKNSVSSESNETMRSREKKYKRTINQLEIKNLELEEKLKYAQQRN